MRLLPSTTFFAFCVALLLCSSSAAQDPVIKLPGGIRTRPRATTTPNTPTRPGTTPPTTGVKKDTAARVSTVERRDYSDDSLQVEVYNLGAVRSVRFDSSITDWTLRFPIPATHLYLGNEGSATRSYLFAPVARTGWDPGFHSHDVYRLKLDEVRFFNTAKPFTELGYMLASGQQQMIDILHTQNVKPYWNVGARYRLLGAPGIFRNQRNNHTNYQIASWYQSPNKRYNNYFVLLNNRIQAGESGGIRRDKNYLDDPNFQRGRFTVPTMLGGVPSFGGNLFATTLYTGRQERDFTAFLRQQYDLGRKDSLVTDSTVIPLFYPRLRFEHSLRYSSYSFRFQDFRVSDPGRQINTPDSAYYDSLYDINTKPNDSVLLQDTWREVSNDFSVYQFPDANNLQQFIKVGAELQLISGRLRTERPSLYNIILHGEYRNRTKNQKWDIAAFGRLHSAGNNAGDYHAYVSLQRLLSQQLGTLQVGFENFNRSPSFLYDQRSSFYLDAPKSFGKENTAHAFARYYIPKLRLQLGGDYYFVTNYLYLSGYRTLRQDAAVFNLLRVSGSKTFRVGRKWNLYTDVYVQQKAGGVELNVPLVYTRNRFAFEGKLFRNLNLSTGLELRYHTPYKADNYSPVLGQFFYQDTLTISNRPEVHAFVHMRIRSFKLYIRGEHLNAVSTRNGFGFNNNNFAAPYYPLPGLVIRFGIYWSFVN